MNAKEYARKKFSERLDTIFKSHWKPKTNKEFAAAMNKLYERDGRPRTCTHQQVSDWKRGNKYPSQDNINYISEVLGVDPEFFEFLTTDERLRFDDEYKDQVSRDFFDKMQEKKLNPKFFDFVVSRPNFWKAFPFTSDILLPNRGEGKRPRNQIVVGDNKRAYITLMEQDLDFMKEVQSKVEETVSYMFWKRSQELREKNLEETVKWCLDNYDITEETVRKFISENNRPDIQNITLRERCDLQQTVMDYSAENGILMKYVPLDIPKYNVDPETHKINKMLSGMTDEELEDFYNDCEKRDLAFHNEVEKERQKIVSETNKLTLERQFEKRKKNGKY